MVAKEAENVLVGYIPVWCTGEGTCGAEPPTRAGWKGTDFLAAGSRDSVTGWANTDPPPLARTCWRAPLAWQSNITARATHSCVPTPIQALQQLQGLGEHSPTRAEVVKEDIAPSLVPELLPKETPALVLGRGWRLAHHAAAPAGTFHCPSRSGVPCHLGCSTCAHVPKHERMACAVEAGPSPCPPRPPARCEAHAMARQMRVWHRLTSSEGSGMSGAPCPPAWPSKAEEGLKVRSLCGWLLEAAGGGCRDCWVGGPLWCNGCPDWLLGWGTCKPCCMEVWDWSVLPGWGICGGGKKQEKKVRPQGTSARGAWLCNCML